MGAEQVPQQDREATQLALSSREASTKSGPTWGGGARAEGGTTWSSISPDAILQGRGRGPEMGLVPVREGECRTAQTTVLCFCHRVSFPPHFI